MSTIHHTNIAETNGLTTSFAGARRSVDIAMAADRISAIRQVQIGGAIALLVVGLIAGTLAVNPLALLITFALLKPLEQGKRWARVALVIQQIVSILVGVAVIAVAPSTVGVIIGIIAIGIGVFTLVAASGTAALLAPKR